MCLVQIAEVVLVERGSMKMFALFVAAIILFGMASATHGAAEHPNVVLISIDDLNDWVGCLGGHPQALTPNIDRLAARGVLFTNAHCAAPACRPSRAALFTGLAPPQTGVWSNSSRALLDQHPGIPVIPRVFESAGYRTAGCGKLLHQKRAGGAVFQEYFLPEQRWSPLPKNSVGYTRSELPSKGTDRPRHVVELPGRESIVLPLNRMPSDRKPHHPGAESFDWGAFEVADETMGDHEITDWAIEQLQNENARPLLLGVGYYRPHIPLWAPASYFARFAGTRIQLPPVRDNDLSDLSAVARRWALEPVTAGSHETVLRHDQWSEAVKAYLACVTFVDAQVGRLLDAVESGPKADNTLIVLFSDHGWHLGDKQHWGKWTGWERSTRVPLIVVPPTSPDSDFQPGKCLQPVSLLDVYPTLTEMCGVSAPSELRGISLKPLLGDPGQQTDRTIQTWFDEGNATVRSERWRYIRYADGSEELYDHNVDPHEWDNIVDDPDSVAVLEYLRSQCR